MHTLRHHNPGHHLNLIGQVAVGVHLDDRLAEADAGNPQHGAQGQSQQVVHSSTVYLLTGSQRQLLQILQGLD